MRLTKRLVELLVGALLASALAANETPNLKPIRIVLVGDSTVASYANPPKDRPDLTGWGQVFGEFFDTRVIVINHAQSGRSTKSFIAEGLWKKALDAKGDYLFVQFGHNDSHTKDGKPAVPPATDFQAYLRRYIDESRAAGAKPVLVTPVARRTFVRGKIHTSLQPYADAMLKVGKEKGVPVIDLHASSMALFSRLGDEGSFDLTASASDRTHFSRKGARAMARLVADALRTAVPELAPYLTTTTPAVHGTLSPRQRYKVIVTDGGCGGFEAWPDVKRLDHGELLVAFYAGYAHGSPPTDQLPSSGKMALVRSRDNGVTWGPVATIVDSRDDDHDGSLQQLRDGTLICNYFVDIYYRTVEGKEVRGNWWKIALRCVRSKDRGKTWSKPIVIQGPWSYVSATSDAVLERDDGVLLMPVYGWEHTGPWRSGVLFSRDRGQTWGDFVLIEEDSPGKTCEPALVKLPRGRILCMTRNKMAQSVSSDGGHTWSKPQKIPFSGDAPNLLYTSKGLLLCAMRHQGTSVIISADEGKTWRGAYQIDTVGGAYPSMCELADGTIFCVYYEEGPGSNIRAVRFRPRAEGIDFLPPDEWK